jgi:hypothetical protein
LTHARRSSSWPILFFGQRAGSALRREGRRRLSPQYYANQGYVSHVTHDFGSILKFIEETFRLPSLGYADALADDLSDCFNFKEHSRFQKISAPHNAKYIVNDKSPATDPDND